MRIISGAYRGRVLKSPSGFQTRPTSDRLRETLFNVLTPHITNQTRFLDLCAGTGAIGIEALSRGAYLTTFVDISRRSCALIEANLDLLGIPETQTEIVCTTAENFLKREFSVAWNIIYYDPPYSENYGAVLHEIGFATAELLGRDGIFIAEHHFKNNLPDAIGRIRRWRLLKQGENCLSFYEKK